MNINNRLVNRFPTLAKEWHPTKNGLLIPNDFTYGSTKKVWWICKSGHEWIASINNRSRGSGCPYCSGRKVCADNNLGTLNPELAAQWHPKKNIDITAQDVTISSGKKVWWLCKKGHEWKAQIASRNQGVGCPYCAGKIATKSNCLLNQNPILAKSWHPTRNRPLTPKDVTPGSTKKVWWVCKKKHEWIASVGDRSRGTNCPSCHPSTSRAELRIYSELKSLFKKVELRKKIFGVECDVYIPELKVGIEIDGVYYHRNRTEHDKAKTTLLTEKGINLIRLRERGLEKISHSDMFFDKDPGFTILKRILIKIKNDNLINPNLKKRIEEYVKGGKLVNEGGFNHLISNLPSPLYELSLDKLNRQVSLQWHPTKNEPFSPKDITPGSGIKVWWKCDSGHEWKATVAHRNNGTDCPYCAGLKVTDDNSLETIYPVLAKEWHPVKNGSLTPKDVMPNARKKVWWLCSNGHEWKAYIYSRRVGSGCPFCAGKRVCSDNSLKTKNPKLSKDWHRIKNKKLTPNDVTPSSHKKVWWICKKGHEWKASIANRNKGRGCPFCAGQKPSKHYCLQTVNPSLSNEWCQSKNGNLTPNDVTPGSNRKVWWICSKGHQWLATISSRNNGRGCPYCSGKIADRNSCLETLYPQLAQEWHPTKNGVLTPADVTPGSHKKLWWLCSSGHEWKAIIYNRVRGTNCPFCELK